MGVGWRRTNGSLGAEWGLVRAKNSFVIMKKTNYLLGRKRLKEGCNVHSNVPARIDWLGGAMKRKEAAGGEKPTNQERKRDPRNRIKRRLRSLTLLAVS